MILPSTRNGYGVARHLSASLILMGVLHTSDAAILSNGDFSDPVPLAGFTATGSIVAEPTGEFAQLETDGSFTRTLEQSVLLPATPSSLSFDFAYSTDGPPGAGFPDSFAVSLLTTADSDFLDILVVDAFGALADPSDGIEGLTGALPIDVTVDFGVGIAGFDPFAGGPTFSGRLSLSLPTDVRGEEATLFFDLFDELDARSSIAALDNIVISSRAIPEPASGWLVLLGLVGSISRSRSAPRAASRKVFSIGS